MKDIRYANEFSNDDLETLVHRIVWHPTHLVGRDYIAKQMLEKHGIKIPADPILPYIRESKTLVYIMYGAAARRYVTNVEKKLGIEVSSNRYAQAFRDKIRRLAVKGRHNTAFWARRRRINTQVSNTIRRDLSTCPDELADYRVELLDNIETRERGLAEGTFEPRIVDKVQSALPALKNNVRVLGYITRDIQRYNKVALAQ